MHRVKFYEWLPEKLEYETIQETYRASDQPVEKTFNNFSFVFCIGGDGTLMRLLRVLYFRCLPPTLPKIITISLGSLSYLCNFGPNEIKDILEATALAKSPEHVRSLTKVDYRGRLACSLEDYEKQMPIPWKRMFTDSNGDKEC